MSVLVVGQDFSVLAAVRAQLRDERVHLATDHASARAVAERRGPEIVFVHVVRCSDLTLARRLAAHHDVVVIAKREGLRRLRDIRAATRIASARGFIPIDEITRCVRPMVETIRDNRAPASGKVQR